MTRIVSNTAALKNRRIKMGFSLRALAEKSRVSHTHIGKIEDGDRAPSPAVAKRICKALKAEFDDLFTIVRRTKKTDAKKEAVQ